MNKFEDHWREKMNDPEKQKDFLKQEVKADMWEKIQASKKGFEQTWQKNADNIDNWDGILAKEDKQAIWDQLQLPLTQFEAQWHDRIGNEDQRNDIFLAEISKERIAATVFSEKENFESDWQDKINDPAHTDEHVLNPASKDRIWNTIQSGTSTTGTAPKEKRKPLFALRWSHAAALLVGAFSTWLIWNQTKTPLQSTLVVMPQSEEVAPVATHKETTPSEQQEPIRIEAVAIHKHAAKTIVKSRTNSSVKEGRNAVERVAGKATSVKPVQSGIVLANATPVIKTAHPINTTEDKINTNLTSEKEIATSIVKAPAKKVVHISDIRPTEIHTKGTSIYSRAFGEGREKRKEKSIMTFNSVLKNYK